MSVYDKLKEDFISGIVFLTPIAVTLYVAYWVSRLIIRLPGTEHLTFTGIPIIDQFIQLLVSIFVFGLFILGLGHLVRTVLSSYAKRWSDNIMTKIPVLGVIYKASRLAVETLSSGTSEFKKPVKIELGDIRLTGFKTGETSDGRQIIFLPTTPNITTGFLLEMKDEDVEISDESVKEALTRILSIGLGDSKKEEVKTVLKDQDIDTKKTEETD